MPSIEQDTFTCEACGGAFLKNRSDEEAEREFSELFPDDAGTPRAVVCSECFRELTQR